MKTITKFIQNNDERQAVQNEATVLLKRTKNLDIVFMIVFWHKILRLFDATGVALQENNLDIFTDVFQII
jgi:hypothetical protein